MTLKELVPCKRSLRRFAKLFVCTGQTTLFGLLNEEGVYILQEILQEVWGENLSVINTFSKPYETIYDVYCYCFGQRITVPVHTVAWQSSCFIQNVYNIVTQAYDTEDCF